jgi:hypothetical protein
MEQYGPEVRQLCRLEFDPPQSPPPIMRKMTADMRKLIGHHLEMPLLPDVEVATWCTTFGVCGFILTGIVAWRKIGKN